MADYQNPPVEDPSASTQMFKAFVDEPTPQPATAVSASEGGRTGRIALGLIVAVVIVAAVVYLAMK